MKFIPCLLVVAFTLPLLVASDDDVQRRGLSASGGLKGSSAKGDQSEEQEPSSRQLTWSRWLLLVQEKEEEKQAKLPPLLQLQLPHVRRNKLAPM